MKKITLTILTFVMIIIPYSSNSAEPVGVVFGRIYTGFYYSLDKDFKSSGFDFTTGILGYSHKLSDKVNAILLYDVTRTTNLYFMRDSNGDTLGLNYFEGSKYTAFLKMAQINWKIKPSLELSVGQLLNEQYLTVQDNWWGHRYVRVTFQEAYRYGMPADFGARISYKTPGEKVKLSVSAVNGDGPFKYQDAESKFLTSFNIEYSPIKKILLKLYSDIEQPSSTLNGETNKTVISGFAGYKSEKLMIGAELNFVNNFGFIKEDDYSGFSIYSSYNFMNKLSVFGRLDFGNLTSTNTGHYGILGLQYEPEKNYFIAVNYRKIEYSLLSNGFTSTINVNFGIKF